MSLKILGLPESATEEDVKAAWRGLASAHHPDRGGDPAEFSKYQKAYRAALAESATSVNCPKCEGSGTRDVGTGFNKIKMRCLNCHGARKIPRSKL